MATLRLNLRRLDKASDRSIRSISRRSDISWPTVHKYLGQPEKVQHLSLESLGSVLAALGYTPAEIRDLRLGDVFDVSDDGGGGDQS